MWSRYIVVVAAAASLAGCSSEPTDGTCEGAKCDTPGDLADRECSEYCATADGIDEACFDDCRWNAAVGLCELRRSDALDSSQPAFSETTIRWSCSDVEGVNTFGQDDRGQEYCEYFAVLELPPEIAGGEPLAPAIVGQVDADGFVDVLAVELTSDQIIALEDEPDAVVGQCVFSSWHADVFGELPVCDGGCPELQYAADAYLPSWKLGTGLGIPASSEYLQMKLEFNTNDAASNLVYECMSTPLVGDPEDAEDPLHDDFVRGCMTAYTLFETEWRRSDTAICAASTRLGECGCGIDLDGDYVADLTTPEEVAFALVPPVDSLPPLGFPIGTWSSRFALPAGCRYVDTGDDSRLAVTCDIVGQDLLFGAADPKELCRAKYGDNVVVHIDIPAGSVVCDPPKGGEYAASCTETPWTL